MAITIILHEATRTGAPRLGGLIARELARDEDARVLVMKDGPLTPWLRQLLGAQNVVVCRGDPFHFRVPFDERLRLAGEMLEGDPADLIYANSLATSVFAFAAAQQKRRTIVHVHEKIAEMVNLLAHDATKLDLMRLADAAVLAAEDIAADLIEVFGTAPPIVETLGVAVDLAAVREAALAPAPSPLNARGEALQPGERMIVAMSGQASARKGVDIFFGVAAALPDRDFLWIGGWRPEDTADNIAYDDFLARNLPNFYVTGPVDNPFPYMRMLDLFFLSSREDPNPLVLGEALALNRPLLCFSQTTAIADRLGRCGIVCHGRPNVADAARVIGACSTQALRSPAFRNLGEAYVGDYDLNQKMESLRDLIARLRGVAPARTARFDATGVQPRYLETGAVELTFS
ncbi:MAG: glycosyltransferase [Pseudomonadota bacterium]|nr:glycosyltransferase [Pseudomonadota bacterium]